MYQFLAVAFSTFASEDLACIAAGNLAAQAQMSLAAAMTAAFAGIFLGDLMLYGVGFYAGRGVLRLPWFRKYLNEEKLFKAQAWFHAKGGKIVFLSRFLPGTRLPTYLTAGILRMPVSRFSGLLFLAALVWTPILVAIAYFAGAFVAKSGAASPVKILSMTALSVLLVYAMLSLTRKLSTYKSRRLIYARLQRILRWEFWPMLWLYIPVGVYLFLLAIRHRRLLAFTAANPGIPDSGIKGESKSEILGSLRPKGAGFGRVAPFRKIPPGTDTPQRLRQVRSAMRTLRMKFPVVLKPDAGERGNGVVIARDETAVAKYVTANSDAFIVQKYVPGCEYGVFYYRYPNETHGHVFAITDKRMITLTGDGKSDLETLILSDPRAILMADFHLDRHAANLRSILASGMVYPLVELGTHCKGALFLDGAHLITQELTRAIDRISKNFAGFYFGRYDVRVPDEQHLRAGKKISVIELNGVTSEATSIYDPKHSIFFAYRTLFKQWRIATEIGLQNIRRDHTTTSLRQLIRLAR